MPIDGTNVNRKLENRPMSNIVRNTILAVAVAASTLAITASAYAVDPTQGRINARKQANMPKYHRCAAIHLRGLQACRNQSNGNVNRIRSCNAMYQRGLAGCRATYL